MDSLKRVQLLQLQIALGKEGPKIGWSPFTYSMDAPPFSKAGMGAGKVRGQVNQAKEGNRKACMLAWMFVYNTETRMQTVRVSRRLCHVEI